jgi:hypothetical protein
MNEQIEELAEKIWAKEYWDNPNTDKLLPAQLNKFAELLVKECISIAISEMVRAEDIDKEDADERCYLMGNNGGILDAVGAIRLHFGV